MDTTVVMNLQTQSSQSFDLVSDDGREQDIEEGAAITPAAAEEKQDQNFVRRETRLIMWLKIMVLMVLLVAMIVMSCLAYRSVKIYEVSLFDTRFRDDAMSLISNFYQEEANRIRTTALGANLYQIYSQFLGVPLHICNLPGLFGFDYLGFSSASLAYGENILFAPVVYDEAERELFESYAALIGDDDLGNASFHNRSVGQGIFELNGTTPVNSIGSGPFAPVFQIYPAEIKKRTLMFDLMSEDVRGHAFRSMISSKKYVMSKTLDPQTETQLSTKSGEGGGPTSIFMMPIFDEEGKVGGTSATETDWKRSFGNILQNEKAFIHVVLENTCGESFTFLVHGMDVKLLGPGDHHNSKFNSFELTSSINGFRKFWADQQTATPPQGYRSPLPPAEKVDGSLFHFGDPDNVSDISGCEYRIRLYPTEAFEGKYLTTRPVVYTSFVCGIFLSSAVLFLLYDCLVERRQTVVMTKAVKSSAIINGLFPKIVQERLFSGHEKREKRLSNKREADPFRDGTDESSRGRGRLSMSPAKIQLRSIINSGNASSTTFRDGDEDMSQSAPIADLFPNTTVMFADIAGFTAWSSEREPAQVFILLETLYNEFDEIANRNGVFKVETIGDCYVAAAGLPEPNHDHAVVLARFAWECLLTMGETCKRLEATLGPGTGDLALRVGLHSGPTTAGVLRGEKSRFQLFGDTMNTASRMESNGLKNMVQVSEATANILTARGKAHWLVPREEKIEAKGKGTMQTYWMRPNRRGSSATGSVDGSYCQGQHSDLSLLMLSNSSSSSNLQRDELPPPLKAQPQRLRTWSTPAIKYEKNLAKEANLVDWNVEVLMASLQKVVAMRECTKLKFSMLRRRSSNGGSTTSLTSPPTETFFNAPIEELIGIIELPDFSDEFSLIMCHDTDSFDGTVRDELRLYVSKIASMYRDNPFHNFEHASHVTMSANKLMNRIVLPEDVDYRQGDTYRKEDEVALLQSVHNSTFGISSDPLAQFAIIFSALIHDIDHTGLTNSQLVKEKADIAVTYKGLSVAEQNSVTVAWGILLRPEYERLCLAIFPTPSERIRFRQLVVNAVLATDIVDAKLTELRKNRWDEAFHETSGRKSPSEDRNRKATIVMEHIIQASDVAHSMQHWRIYCKWNEKLFEERYRSFLEGHEEEDPAIHWYENEIRFFDNYVIPLANKLAECGVFGVSSDEYLGFAIENRMEWEMKGRDVVHHMLRRIRETMKLAPKEVPEENFEHFQPDDALEQATRMSGRTIYN